ncbi:MAG: arylsulfotransferase, partial [Ignavibacteriae bacterium]|nr:arylsulfotransferase [Ignavibacteriota bacterium]
MPNGNVLALVWEQKTKEEALELGRDPEKLGNVLWSEKIVEIKPNGMSGGTV